MTQELSLEPIGVVHSAISNTKANKIPLHGVETEIEVFDKYLDGLEGIETKSHIFVLCWLHRSDRATLQVKPCKRFFPDGMVPEGVPARGVFATRSPTRPNPISLTVTKLLGRNGNRLKVILDVVDGTPVIDIKPYSVGWDSIPSAQGGEGRFSQNAACYASLTKEAANFHGEECPGLAIGVRIALKAIRDLNMNLREPGLKISATAGGCLIDAMQGLTGATLGNKRLTIREAKDSEESITFLSGKRGVRFEVKPYFHLSLSQIAVTSEQHLFTISESEDGI